MIVKIQRNGYDNLFDLKVIDKNNHSFTMMVGGNLDLYWVPDNHKECREFIIEEKDNLTFSIFSQLFNAIEKKDDANFPSLKDNVFTFISEEWTKEESNILEIERLEKAFKINFIKNENEEKWTVPHRGCPICFCNSGSRVPKIEYIFMRMFTYLAYECPLIETTNKR